MLIYDEISGVLETGFRISTNLENDVNGTLSANYYYATEFENIRYESNFARNSDLRASSAGGLRTSVAPLRTVNNNNHYANLQIDDQISSNNTRSEDKKVLFKVPFPTSFNGSKLSGPYNHIKQGAGPLTKPPPSFLQPKSKYASSLGGGTTEPSNPQQLQQIYADSTTPQVCYQGRNNKVIELNIYCRVIWRIRLGKICEYFQYDTNANKLFISCQ